MKDMEDVPPTVKKDVKFYFVEHYEEIPPIALKNWKPVNNLKKMPRQFASRFPAAV